MAAPKTQFDPVDVALTRKFRKSPLLWVEKMFGLTPQPFKEKFREEADAAIQKGDWGAFQADWFEPFVKGKHITWQQYVILLAVERAMKGRRKVTVASGRGIGKSATLSWLLLWYLFCYIDAQIPCTAPTSTQMFDVLWKEAAKWIDRLPLQIKPLYDWTATYIRIKERPQTWFASARTGSKESPEALAGIHGDYVELLVDEASGIPDEIFLPAEGILTSKNSLMVMISNPTRLIGYFYDSHHKMRENWEVLSFSSAESPIVDPHFIEQTVAQYGMDSDEYRIFVEGKFPRADSVDRKGYVPLLLESDLRYIPDFGRFMRGVKLGVDPAGEGDNKTVWVVRDQVKAKIAGEEDISNAKSIAEKTVTLMDFYGVKEEDVVIDNFGVGAGVVAELAYAGYRVRGVNVGEKPDDEERYTNKRAEAFYRLRQWVMGGGELVRDKRWEQLLGIRYRREQISNKLKVMGKQEMRMEGIPSPDCADSLMLTFISPERKANAYVFEDESNLMELIDVYH